MNRGKYETHVRPYLDHIVKWVSQGAGNKEIADKLHIGLSTLLKYLTLGRRGEQPYVELIDAFTRARKEPDDHVEAALYKRACGYQYTEVTQEEYLDHDGQIYVLKKEVTKDMPPDPTSCMFWLTNRRKGRWSYRPELLSDNSDTWQSGIVLLPAVSAAPSPPPDDAVNGEGGVVIVDD